jgi:hypothetical protein
MFESLPFMPKPMGPPWLPASVAEARKWAYWSVLIAFLILIVEVIVVILHRNDIFHNRTGRHHNSYSIFDQDDRVRPSRSREVQRCEHLHAHLGNPGIIFLIWNIDAHRVPEVAGRVLASVPTIPGPAWAGRSGATTTVAVPGPTSTASSGTGRSTGATSPACPEQGGNGEVHQVRCAIPRLHAPLPELQSAAIERPSVQFKPFIPFHILPFHSIWTLRSHGTVSCFLSYGRMNSPLGRRPKHGS